MPRCILFILLIFSSHGLYPQKIAFQQRFAPSREGTKTISAQFIKNLRSLELDRFGIASSDMQLADQFLGSLISNYSTPKKSHSVDPNSKVNKAENRVDSQTSNHDLPFSQLNLSNENYIFSRQYQKRMSSPEEISNVTDVIEQVTYFDGLGRPKQRIAINAAADLSDIITTIEYDQYGRQPREYLPYAANQQNGAYNAHARAQTESFYNKPKYDNTPNPFSEQVFEASPLNRIMKIGAPGADWSAHPSSETDHTIKFNYSTNAVEEVRLYEVSLTSDFTPTLELSGYYNPTELFLTVTKNENWKPADGVNNTVREYKDKQDRTILERTYENGDAHDTYYVFDGYGNLTFILPPKSEAHSAKPDNIKLNNLCYQYKYDHKNRLVEKKVPGKGWEFIVYNKLDQPILTQDSNLRQQNQWLLTKYDAFGRVIYTGMMSSSDSRETLQAAADSFNTQFEQRTSGASSIAGTTIYYSNNAYPSSNITTLQSIHYYDGYLPTSDQAGISLPSTNHYGEAITDKTKTLATVSRIRVLGANDWITVVRGYDDKGRNIWTREKNPYLDMDHLVEIKLNFVGKVEQSRTTHIKNSVSTIIEDSYTYDHMGRQLTHSQKINNQPEEQIVNNLYDELGRLEQKQVGGILSGQGLQAADYNYNVRGWLKNINDPDNLGNKLFAFEISYNDTQHGGTSLYNGNISETRWKTANDNTLRWYTYDYDALNRITAATAYNSRYNLSNVSYDKNGNITTLSRRGAINTAASSFGEMDILTYTYDPFSNQLKSVNDAGSASFGFKDGSSAVTQYTYDSNGNLTSDANKGITSIDYNHLNLPTTITFDNSTSQTITYIYDATGVKLSKEIPGKITQYAGNFVYEDLGGTMNLQFFSHPEGYVSYDNGQFNYVYQYKDHLGNIRLSYTDANSNGIIDPSTEIIQEKNYYPFGMTHRGYNGSVSSLSNDAVKRYGFGGMELQSENISGNILDWYDVQARNFDPALGRWMSVDPLADDHEQVNNSPYVFNWNNSMMYVDPSGLKPETVLDRYKLLDDGTIEYYDDKGGDAVDYLIDTDGNEIQIGHSDILPQLSEKRNQNGTNVAMASTGSHKKGDLAELFVFIANRSDNEWRLIQTKSDNYILGTKFDTDYSPSSTALGLSGDSEIRNSVHSHPNIYIKPGDSRFYSEQKSMGYFIANYAAYGDWGNTINAVRNNNMSYPYREYIYMPESGRLWNAGYNQPNYIRNLNNDGSRLFFGRF